MTEINDHIATRRQIDLDTFKVTYICGSCRGKVECSLKSAVLRKDLGQYCGDPGKTGSITVILNTLPVIDRDYWKTQVNYALSSLEAAVSVIEQDPKWYWRLDRR